MKPSHNPFALLLLAAAAVSQAPAVHAQTVNPVPAPTIITTAPYTISAAGYYQLGANLNYSGTTGNIITVNASNVILDFAGHYISGPTGATTTSTLFGVGSVDHGNITIQNGTIANCYEGTNFYGSNNGVYNYNNTVNNMLITFCSHVGINFQSTLYSRATNNVVSNTGGATAANGTGNYALFLQGLGSSASGNLISVVMASSNGAATAYGIYINSGYTAFAVKNQIADSYYGIFFSGTGKYQDNLTLGCTTSFTGGTDAGGNN